MSRSGLVNLALAAALLLVGWLHLSNGLSLLWLLLPLGAYLVLMVYVSSVLSAQFFMPAKCRAKDGSPRVALSFDDGPVAGKTEAILDILQAEGIRAAFFCIGRQVRKHPELLKRMHAEGHLIGNHSYHHRPSFGFQNTDSVLQELQETDRAIEEVIGLRPAFFRPPYGVANPMIARALRQSGHQVMGWSLRSFDTRIRQPRQLLRRITRSMQAGDILLLHDHSESMIQVLPQVLQYIREQGWQVVRPDELLNEKPYA